MNSKPKTKIIKHLLLTLSFFTVIASTNSWALGELQVVTNEDDEILPTPKPDPIRTEYIFSGYICEMDVRRHAKGEISLLMKNEPLCQGSTIGFAKICFSPNGIGLSCPHEDNPSRHGHIYDVTLKPAMITTMQAAMMDGQKIKVYRLSNAFDYPHYDGPLMYGNVVVLSAQ